MKNYSVGIKFEKEKHCLRCPLRDNNSDCCSIQVEQEQYITFENLEEQMENCLLTEIKKEG